MAWCGHGVDQSLFRLKRPGTAVGRRHVDRRTPTVFGSDAQHGVLREHAGPLPDVLEEHGLHRALWCAGIRAFRQQQLIARAGGEPRRLPRRACACRFGRGRILRRQVVVVGRRRVRQTDEDSGRRHGGWEAGSDGKTDRRTPRRCLLATSRVTVSRRGAVASTPQSPPAICSISSPSVYSLVFIRTPCGRAARCPAGDAS